MSTSRPHLTQVVAINSTRSQKASNGCNYDEVRRSRYRNAFLLLLVGGFFLDFFLMTSKVHSTITVKTHVVIMSFKLQRSSTHFTFHIVTQRDPVINYIQEPMMTYRQFPQTELNWRMLQKEHILHQPLMPKLMQRESIQPMTSRS